MREFRTEEADGSGVAPAGYPARYARARASFLRGTSSRPSREHDPRANSGPAPTIRSTGATERH